MPPFWVCGVFLLVVLYLLSVVVRLMARHGTADGARRAVIYLLLCVASFVFLALDDGLASQVTALVLTLPLSLVLAKGGDTADRIPTLVFCAVANASTFLILFGLYQRARRSKRAAAADNA
jgi:flagellar biosynthesis component FlhA